jgi:hypothetical protein
MKTSVLFLLASLSLPAFAFMNEVECDGRVNGKRARLEVENRWGGFRNATLTLWGARGTNPEVVRYMVNNSGAFGGRVQYIGNLGFRLEVDLWPDRVPQWGRQYRASFSATNVEARFASCYFPNVRP